MIIDYIIILMIVRMLCHSYTAKALKETDRGESRATSLSILRFICDLFHPNLTYIHLYYTLHVSLYLSLAICACVYCHLSLSNQLPALFSHSTAAFFLLKFSLSSEQTHFSIDNRTYELQIQIIPPIALISSHRNRIRANMHKMM